MAIQVNDIRGLGILLESRQLTLPGGGEFIKTSSGATVTLPTGAKFFVGANNQATILAPNGTSYTIPAVGVFPLPGGGTVFLNGNTATITTPGAIQIEVPLDLNNPNHLTVTTLGGTKYIMENNTALRVENLLNANLKISGGTATLTDIAGVNLNFRVALGGDAIIYPKVGIAYLLEMPTATQAQNDVAYNLIDSFNGLSLNVMLVMLVPLALMLVLRFLKLTLSRI